MSHKPFRGISQSYVYGHGFFTKNPNILKKGLSVMRLTDEEKSILDGKQGEAARIALSVLVDLGEVFGAEELMKVSQVHIDTTVYMLDAGLEFAERLADLGGGSSGPHLAQS
ncbi:MAG: DUF521 domain-containing protein [Gammaproteobacteria bacterium]|nr:DUF521 domain-containing protein [Gammaproteobacteria bacterium]